MNRLLWGILLAVVTIGSGWAQSTWRGQAEVWPAASAPAEGFVAASNEFPRNSLLTVENYRAKKTVQVRVVATLPSGSSALVLLNAKAAAALDIKAGDAPLVGVRIDPSGVERADNPDPDVNPLAAKPAAAASAPAASAAPAPAAVATAPAPAPAAPEPVRAAPSSLEVVRAATTPDPALIPLPTLANPEPAPAPVAEPAALAVADEPESPAPVTPGRKVFVATRDPEPIAAETPVEVVEPAPAAEPAVEMAAEVPVPAPVPEPVPAAPEPAAPAPAAVAAEEPAPAVRAPEVPAAPEPAPVVAPAPVAAVTPAPAVPAPAPANAGPLAAPAPRPDQWVSVPGKLEGPVLGQVSVLPALDRGRTYVQVGAYASEAALMAALAALKSYVPVSVYQAAGEKNPWRVLVAGAPKAQLGLLLMHFRSQGFRTAAVVKG